MLNITLTDDHLAVQDMCRSIATEVVAVDARAAESQGAVSPGAWKSLAETGLTLAVDEELGGGGVPDVLTHLIAAESLAYGDPGITLAAMWNGAVAFLLGQHGARTHAQVIAGMLSDVDLRAGLALYEGYGRGLDELTTIVEVTDAGVRVRGRKVAVPFAATATFFLVIGVDSTSRALRLATVPADTPGITVAAFDDGALALTAAGLGTLEFDVSVPATALVGGADLTLEPRAPSLQRTRLLLPAFQLGAAQHAVDYASKYATERIAFGKPIAAFQGVAFPLAEAQMRLAQLRLEIAEAACRLDADHSVDHSCLVSAAVAYAADVAPDAARTAVQTLGGHGFVKDHPVELGYRSCAALSALDFDPLASVFAPAL